MTVELDAITQSLNTRYPCREAQVSSLLSVIGHSSFPTPQATCLTGFPATGKATITRALLQAMNTEFVWVDCNETISSPLLFDRIVNGIRMVSKETQLERVKMSADVNNFVVEVHRALEGLVSRKVILVPPRSNIGH